MSKTLIFFGNERIATGLETSAPVLRRLIADGYTIAAVVIAQSNAQKSRKERPLEVAEIAKQHNIPVLYPTKLSELTEKLAAYGAVAGVLVAFGKMVPDSIIELFPAGIINIHPSLLPLHRGPTPIESAILDGDTETGVSLMLLATEMDAGPVFAQEQLALNGNETKQELADALVQRGAEMLSEALPKIIDGTLSPTPQQHSNATYDALIHKSDGVLDPNKPAIRLAREVRAYANWPKTTTTLGQNLEVIIVSAEAVAEQYKPGSIVVTDAKELLIGTKEGSLRITELMPLGKQKMTTAAFLNGYSGRIAEKL